jgi:aminopeptidase N
MLRRLTCVLATAALSFALVPAVSTAQLPSERSKPGAPGAGDPYFPLDGNGGYDVKHYDIRVAYHPATDRLRGVVRIKARATQNLSAFNLDFDGMKVNSVRVNKQAATWRRHRGELTVKPSHGIRKGRIFRTQVRYDGVPKRLGGAGVGGGFFHGNNRALALGQPHSASTWFPVNDHPIDKATYTIHVTVPG